MCVLPARACGHLQVGIPLSVSPLLMYVRRDILAAHHQQQQGLSASGALSTWSGLIRLAATLNGTVDSDGDGQPDYALCLPLHVPCAAASLLTAVFASLAQTQGGWAGAACVGAISAPCSTPRAKG
jgi:hypothetical protein